VAAAIIDTLQELKLAYPTVDRAQKKDLEEARVQLEEKK
jgi:hypothetical protein